MLQHSRSTPCMSACFWGLARDSSVSTLLLSWPSRVKWQVLLEGPLASKPQVRWRRESHRMPLLWTPMEFYRGKANCIISQQSLGLIRITALRAGNKVARHRAALPPSIPAISKSTTIFNCREVKRSSQAAWTCQSSNWALLTQQQL